MRFSHDLVQRAEQRLMMLPKMLQAIEVLQLSTTDLRGLVEKTLGENEMLELDPNAIPRSERAGEPSEDHSETRPSFDVEDAERAPRRLRDGQERSDRKQRALESVRAPGESLADSLHAQIALADLEPEFESAVLFVVEHLDPRTGWLPFTSAELAERSEGLFEHPEILAARSYLQTLEPRGVGAADAIESLMLQLDPRRSRDRLVARILSDHLEDVARNRLPRVAKQLGVEVEEVLSAIERLRDLDPRPGARFLQEAAPEVRPEVVVEAVGSEFEVRLEEGVLPALRLTEHARTLKRERGLDRQVRSYLRERIGAARDFITAIEQRRRTLLLVAQAIFRHQRSFLLQGTAGLEPLRMQEIAEEIGIHVSTVSRAIAGVHAQTPRGIVALRDLFRASMLDSGEAVARGSAHDALRQVMAEEDPRHPFSDDEIRERLRERHGLALARRTVTKYRKELGIPSSWRRRSHL